ncbi:SCO family protein [Verrucomicrobiales bacterium BCK34]|nr:SCO family protein [Verrucomicrobiales bacterium BCK34]
MNFVTCCRQMAVAVAALSLISCEKEASTSGVIVGEFREVADFAFTNQSGESLNLEDLRGKIWIANFIFTSCAAECLVLSSRLSELQMQLKDFDDVAFVSFSVDPQTDTPERLNQYSERWHADSERWNFLTGDSAEIDSLVLNSFLLPVTRNPVEAGKLLSESLIHTDRMAIVDKNGKVRAYVNGLSPGVAADVARIVMQIRREPYPSPPESSAPSDSN